MACLNRLSGSLSRNSKAAELHCCPVQAQTPPSTQAKSASQAAEVFLSGSPTVGSELLGKEAGILKEHFRVGWEARESSMPHINRNMFFLETS